MKKTMNAAAQAVRSGLSEEGSKRRYYAIFTLLFFLTAVLVLCWFWGTGRALISKTDGWDQYYKAYVYYGRYLRQIFRTLFLEHRLEIPGWDHTIGEGADVLTTLHYYVIGDPLALLTVLVPTKWMHLYYEFCIVLRLYLAGIFYSMLCFGLGIQNRWGILTGALSYSFCAWGLRNAARHFVFLMPLVTLPLVILGIEKICRRERPFLYIGTIAVCAACNFYFFYMTGLIAAVYALLRVLPERKRIGLRNMFLLFLKLAAASLLGICMAAVILLPVIHSALGDSRMGIGYAGQLFYSRNYYSILPYIALTAWNTGNYLGIGLTGPAFLACVRLFCSRQEGKLERRLLLLCGLVILFPFLGRVANGFSYAANRWSFGLALLTSVILAKRWEELFEEDLRQRRWFLLGIAALTGLCLLLEKSRKPAAFAMIVLYLFAAEPACKKKTEKRQALLCLLTVLNIFAMSLFLFAPGEGDLASMSIDRKDLSGRLTEAEAVKQAALSRETLPRYTGRGLEHNANVIGGVSSTQYYWSLSNPAVNAFQEDMELRDIQYQKYEGYDDRTALIGLDGIQYYVSDADDQAGLPWGFVPIETVDLRREQTEDSLLALRAELGTEELSEAQEQKLRDAAEEKIAIYRNQYALPLGYCYDTVMGEDQWKKMDAVQKQQAQLMAAYVQEKTALPAADPVTEVYSVPFSVTVKSPEINWQGDRFTVTADKASAVLTFEGLPESEVYVELRGLDYTSFCRYGLYFGGTEEDPENLYNRTNWELLSREEQTAIRREKALWEDRQEVTLTFRSSEGVKKELLYMTDGARFTSGRSDFIVNLGYTEDVQTGVTITFPARGIYRVEELKVLAVPVKEARQAFLKLRENALENVEIGTDTVRGTITVESLKLLCLAIPWSEGWSVFLDGEEAPVLKVNDRHLGIEIPAGTHGVILEYRTPRLREGALLSLGSGMVFLGLIVRNRRKKRNTFGDFDS